MVYWLPAGLPLKEIPGETNLQSTGSRTTVLLTEITEIMVQALLHLLFMNAWTIKPL
jgi:hypothetical protein